MYSPFIRQPPACSPQLSASGPNARSSSRQLPFPPLVLVVLSLAGALSGRCEPGPGQIALSDLIHDWGNVAPLALLRYDMVFTNVGKAVIELKDVHPSCGCIRIGEWPRQLAPGSRGIIALEFQTSDIGGPFDESVTLTPATPGIEAVTVRLRGTVWRPVEAVPGFVVFPVTPDSPTNQTAWVRLVNRLEQPVKVSDLRSEHPGFNADLTTVRPGREYRVGVRAVRPLGTGNTYARFTAKTSAAEAPEVTFTVMVPALAAVVATPARVFLETADPQHRMERTVAIRSTTPHRLALNDASVLPQEIGMTTTEPEPGRLFLIKLSFPPGYDPSTHTNAALVLRTNHPQHPTLRVPIVPQPADITAP